jgi:myo-inositol 2-dehydrogenase/D-chiro-inositol 1-dehydrogenase
VEFEDADSAWPTPGSMFTTATRIAFRAKYADGMELTCETRAPGFGARFGGSEGWVQVGSKGLSTSSKSLKTSSIRPNETHLPESVRGKPTADYQFVSSHHVRNSLNAVKSGQDPIAPVEIGHRSATICHLGNIAMKLKRKIKWDPETEKKITDDEAAAMLNRPTRAPWTI